jgi:hypothetical protein
MRGIDRFLAAILLAGALGSTAMFARHLGSVPELQVVHLAAPPQHVTASGTVRAPVLVPFEGTPARARAKAQPVLAAVRPAAVPQEAATAPQPGAPRPRPQAPLAAPEPVKSSSPTPSPPATPPVQPVQQPTPPEAPRVLAAVPPAARSKGHGRLTAPGQLKKLAASEAKSSASTAPVDVPAPVAALVPAAPADLPEGDDDEGPGNGNAGWHGEGHGRGHGKHE